jgi:hypothetical protein
MKVRYEEGPESLLIAEVGVQAERGEAVEVPNEVGEKLVSQGWTEVKTNSKKKEGDA